MNDRYAVQSGIMYNSQNMENNLNMGPETREK